MKHETEQTCLYLCMGSACHQLGVYDVLPKLRELIERYRLDLSVELKGAFCLGPCSDGIVLKYKAMFFTRIRPQNIEEKFINEMLPHLRP